MAFPPIKPSLADNLDHGRSDCRLNDDTDLTGAPALVQGLNCLRGAGPHEQVGPHEQKEIVLELYRHLAPKVRKVRGRLEAEDLMQDVMFVVIFKTGNTPIQSLGFVNRKVTQVAADAGRALSRYHRHLDRHLNDLKAAGVGSEDRHDGPEGTIEKRYLMETLRGAIQELPEEQRKVLIAVHFEDQSYEKVALSLGIPEGTVKSRVHAAITALGKKPAVKKLRGLID